MRSISASYARCSPLTVKEALRHGDTCARHHEERAASPIVMCARRAGARACATRRRAAPRRGEMMSWPLGGGERREMACRRLVKRNVEKIRAGRHVSAWRIDTACRRA